MQAGSVQVGKPRLDLGLGEPCIDLPVELLDNFDGRVLGRADSIHQARLVAGRNSPTVGMSGSASERVAVVTASARSLPALMYSIDAPGGEHDLHLPADQIGECGRRPRYGT